MTPDVENSSSTSKEMKSSEDVRADENIHKMTLEELLQGLGLGKAHFLIWSLQFLMAMMYLIVYFKTTILIPYLRCEWGLDSTFEAAIGSVYTVFVVLGGIFFGNLADKFGRKKVILATSLVMILGCILAAVSPNKWVFLCARVIQGACHGIGFPVIFVFAAEIASSEFKELAIFLIYMGAQLGGVFLSVMSYLVLNEIGWRYLIAVVSAPLVIVVIGLLLTPETPRFLLVSSKKEEALLTIKKYYKWNGRSFPEGCSGLLMHKTEKGGQFLGLFRHGLGRLTVLLSTIFFANLYIWLAFAAYLPLALDKNAENLTSDDGKCGNSLDQAALIGVVVAFLGDVVGCTFAAISKKKLGNVGRKVVFRGLAVVALLATIPFFFDLPKVVTDILSMVLRFSVTGLRYSFWLLSIEDYPTVLRGTASAFTHAIGNLGGTLGSLLTYVLFPVGPVAVVGLFVGIAMLQLVASILLRTGKKSNLADHTGEGAD